MATWSPSYLMMAWGYGGVVLIQTEGIYLIFIFFIAYFYASLKTQPYIKPYIKTLFQ